MTDDDLLYRFRLRLFGLAHELGSVRAACRALGVHPSTYYRWKHQVDRGGLEMLRPRERRSPRMPNAISVLVSQRIIAFALGHPGFGPARISAELARPLWGGLGVSPAGVYRVLRRHGLATRQKRLGLVAGYACPPDPLPRDPEPERHIEAPYPGAIVQMDAFAIGRLSGTKGIRLGGAPYLAPQSHRPLVFSSGGGDRERPRRSGLEARGAHDRQRR
jgi:transposase